MWFPPTPTSYFRCVTTLIKGTVFALVLGSICSLPVSLKVPNMCSVTAWCGKKAAGYYLHIDINREWRLWKHHINLLQYFEIHSFEKAYRFWFSWESFQRLQNRTVKRRARSQVQVSSFLPAFVCVFSDSLCLSLRVLHLSAFMNKDTPYLWGHKSKTMIWIFRKDFNKAGRGMLREGKEGGMLSSAWEPLALLQFSSYQ